MYDDILIPTGGSDPSAAAVEHGVAIAAPHAATVHLLHAVDVRTEMAASGVGTVADELAETLERAAEDALDAAVARAENEGVAYERVTLEGVPHEAIAAYGTEHGVDLIVMGASGRSGLKEHLLGSTTDRVVRSIDTPVLLARP